MTAALVENNRRARSQVRAAGSYLCRAADDRQALGLVRTGDG